MNYIIFDLEWNQCPQGKKKEIHELPFEIIEIGAVRMDENHRLMDTFHEIISPQVYRTLHYMTRSVIPLTEKDLKGKRHFPEVAADFFRWCGQNPVYCTWGSGDLTEFQRNLAWYNIPSPFPFPLYYIDIQKVFSIVHEDRRTRRSLEYAVDYLKIEKKEIFHDAFCDALYTADIAAVLPDHALQANFSVDYYRTPENRKEEIYLTYETYTKFISRPFRHRLDVLADRVVSTTVCPICGRNCRKKIRWFPSGSKNYLSVAICPEHGCVKGKLRLRQRPDRQWFAIRTHRLITEEESDKIRVRQKASSQKERAKLKAEQ